MAGHECLLMSTFYSEQHNLGLSTSLLQDIVAGIALNLFQVCLLQKGEYWVKQKWTNKIYCSDSRLLSLCICLGFPAFFRYQGSKSWEGRGSN